MNIPHDFVQSIWFGAGFAIGAGSIVTVTRLVVGLLYRAMK